MATTETTGWYTISGLSGFNSKNGYVGETSWFWGKYNNGARSGFIGVGNVNGSSRSAVLVFWLPFPSSLISSNITIDKIEVQMSQTVSSGISSGKNYATFACATGVAPDTPKAWNGSGRTNDPKIFATDNSVTTKTAGTTWYPTYTYTVTNRSNLPAGSKGCYIQFSGGNYQVQSMSEFTMGTTYPRFRFTYTNSSPTPTYYTITYNPNGASGSSVSDSVASGSTYTLRSTCPWSRSGYTFKGWNASSTGTTPANSSQTCTGNKIWYAIWKQNVTQYTARFYPGDHATVSNTSANAISRTYTKGGSLTLLSNTAFTGESDQIYYTTKYYLQGGDITSYNYPSSSSSYTRSGSSSNYCYSVRDDKKSSYSYEYWYGSDTSGVRKCGDTYSNLEGNINMWPFWSETVNYNAYFNPPNASRAGYRLSGWATSPTGTPNYQSGTRYQQSSDQNLYAIWEANQVYINYYTDNDTAQPTDTVVQGPYNVGDTVRLSDGSGWTSSKWGSSVTFYTNYNFQGGSFSNGVTPNSTYSISRTGKYDWVISGWFHGSQHYELQGWITLNSNIGIYPYWADSSSIVSHAAFTPITPIRKGYKFLNWNTQANGNGTAYYTNTNYNTSAIDKDLTLYAIWEPEWTIKINNGTNWGDYHVWIYTGATSNKGWQQAIPYLYDGSNWKITKI